VFFSGIAAAWEIGGSWASGLLKTRDTDTVSTQLGGSEQ